MENNNDAVATAIKRNILFCILDEGTSGNATAIKADIPTSTFHRKLKNPEDFTVKELGKISEALYRQLEDILSSELPEIRRVA